MEQMLWAVVLSFSVTPIVAVMIGKYESLSAVGWIAIVFGLFAMGLNVVALTQDKKCSFQKARAVGLTMGLAWVLFVIGELVDVGIGNKLYLSVTIFDHSLRTAFVDAVMRTGVPPANPLFWPGHAVPMRYYYFWYVVTAVAAHLSGATARQAMIAGTAWSGFGLAAMVGLYGRHFLAVPAGGPDRRSQRLRIGLALLAVTGLDALTVVAKVMLRMPADADVDWWSPDQVTSWLGAVLWVPHHVAGLVCCLLGFLLVWMSKGEGLAQRGLCALVAGVAFASAFGISTWVAVAFAMVMAAWTAWALAAEPGSRVRVLVLACAALVAITTLMPYLAELRGEASGVVSAAGLGADALTSGADEIASGGHLLRFGVRHMIDPEALLRVPVLKEMEKLHPRVEDALAGLILLVPGYFVELGFYGLVLGIAVWKLRAKNDLAMSESTRTALVLTGAGLVVATFVRSTVLVNNDFGTRSMLIAQFFLLLLAVLWWEGSLGATSRWMHRVIVATVWIGVAGTVYQACVLRLYLPVEEMLGRDTARGLAERSMAVRRGLQAMDARVRNNAVVQFDNAQPTDYFRYAEIMGAGRQMVSGLPVCPAAFGGDPSACGSVEDGIARLFSHEGEGDSPLAKMPRTALSGAEARAECGGLGLGYLIATRWDAVWGEPKSWVWALHAVVDTGEVRVLDCRGSGDAKMPGPAAADGMR